MGLLANFFWERGEARAVRGVVSAGHFVGGRTAEEIAEILQQEDKNRGRLKLKLSLSTSQLERSAAQLGVSVDVFAMVHRALHVGRERGLVAQFGFWISRLTSLHELPLQLKVDTAQLRLEVEPWAKELIPPPVLPYIFYQKSLEIEWGRAGRVIEFETLAEQIKDAVTKKSRSAIRIEAREEKAVIEKAEVQGRLDDAQRLVSSSVKLALPGSNAEGRLTQSDLGRSLYTEITSEKPPRFVLHLDISTLRKAARSFLSEIEHKPKNADFEFGPGDKVSIIPSEAGSILDEDAFVAALLALEAGERRSLNVPFKKQDPKVSTAEAESLNVGGLITSFTTHHACCQGRVENIHKAAAELDGTIVSAGQSFSLNRLLGPRTRAAGYLEAPTIVEGEMKETSGGGISQLATTLFNAVLRGGFEIIQRQPHSIYFSRYPEGHEATVSFPEPDLVFKNDSDAPLVIKTQYTGTFIKVLLYGDNGGRKVSTHRSKRFDIVQPPLEYEIDAEMDHERPRRIRAGQMGWSVVVSRTVTFKDGTIREQKRKVVYQPRAELIRVHPCTLPEGQKGYTGEPCPEPEELFSGEIVEAEVPQNDLED